MIQMLIGATIFCAGLITGLFVMLYLIYAAPERDQETLKALWFMRWLRLHGHPCGDLACLECHTKECVELAAVYGDRAIDICHSEGVDSAA